MKHQIKTLPSGIVIENQSSYSWWVIKGTKIFHNEGEPALEYVDGSKYWYQHHKKHRLDGPAVWLVKDGVVFYYINGIGYSEEDYWKHPDVLAFKYLKEHPELEAFV